MDSEKQMAGRKYAYARVSSASQNLDRQLDRLEKYVPAEDTLYLTSLDRLSRNKNDIKCELEWFKTHGVRLIVLDLPTTLVQIPQGQEWIVDMINNIMIEGPCQYLGAGAHYNPQASERGNRGSEKKRKTYGPPKDKETG